MKIVISRETLLKEWRDDGEDKNWLSREIFSSLSDSKRREEITDSIKETGYVEVKLIINDIEVEPKILKDLLENIEKHIDREAKTYAETRVQEIKTKAYKLEEILDDVCDKIIIEFNLKESDY